MIYNDLLLPEEVAGYAGFYLMRFLAEHPDVNNAVSTKGGFWVPETIAHLTRKALAEINRQIEDGGQIGGSVESLVTQVVENEMESFGADIVSGRGDPAERYRLWDCSTSYSQIVVRAKTKDRAFELAKAYIDNSGIEATSDAEGDPDDVHSIKVTEVVGVTEGSDSPYYTFCGFSPVVSF